MINYYETIAKLNEDQKDSDVLAGADARFKMHESFLHDDVLIGEWLVKLNGDMINTAKRDYEIAADDLKSPHRLMHIHEKGWDMNNFLEAYQFALTKRLSIKELTVQFK